MKISLQSLVARFCQNPLQLSRQRPRPSLADVYPEKNQDRGEHLRHGEGLAEEEKSHDHREYRDEVDIGRGLAGRQLTDPVVIEKIGTDSDAATEIEHRHGRQQDKLRRQLGAGREEKKGKKDRPHPRLDGSQKQGGIA